MFLQGRCERSLRPSQGRRARYQGVFALDAFPANSGIGIPRLGANLLLRSVAIASGGPKAYVSSDKVRLTPGSFSQSIQFGHWLYLAGQDSIGMDNQTLAIGDVAEQTTISLQHIKDVMEAAGHYGAYREGVARLVRSIRRTFDPRQVLVAAPGTE